MSLTLVDRVREWPERIALDAPEGRFSYRDLLEGSAAAAAALLDGRADLDGARICFLVPPGWEYVRWQWGIWRAGGVAVPMAVSHPPAELAYVLDDAGPDTVVVHPDFADRLAELVREGGLRSISTGDAEWGGASSGPAAHGASGGPARENARTGTS